MCKSSNPVLLGYNCMMSVADGVLLVDFSCAHLPDSSGVVAFAVKMKRGTGRVGSDTGVAPAAKMDVYALDSDTNVSPHPVQRRAEQQSTSWALRGNLNNLAGLQSCGMGTSKGDVGHTPPGVAVFSDNTMQYCMHQYCMHQYSTSSCATICSTRCVCCTNIV